MVFFISLYSLVDGDVVAMVDIGMCAAYSQADIQSSIRKIMATGYIGSFRVSDENFAMRHIGVDQDRSECCK